MLCVASADVESVKPTLQCQGRDELLLIAKKLITGKLVNFKKSNID